MLPRASRIRILPYFPGVDIAVVCYQCENAPCIESCPVNAITRDKETNAIIIQEELCTGCKACFETCRADAIFMHPTKSIVIKCDLCGGDPECVKHCPEKAIEYKMTPFDAGNPPEEIAKDLVTLLLE